MPWTNDDLSIGGFGQLAQNVDATGRMIRDDKPSPVPQRKPETIAPTRKGNELLDFIGWLESSDNYNVFVGSDTAPLTQMTVKDVRQLQRERRGKKLGTPAGKYQIKDETMDYLTDRMGLRGDEIFDEKMQDQMARHLLKKRSFEDYKAGKISTDDFIKELSREWASIPTDKSNRSYYDRDGKNRALTDYKTVKAFLEKP